MRTISLLFASLRFASLRSAQVTPPNNGKPYFWNRITGKTQFEKPKDDNNSEFAPVEKLLSNLYQLKQDYLLLDVHSTEDNFLEQVQAFMCRCAVIGYSGPEAHSANEMFTAHLTQLMADGKIEASGEEYRNIQIKAQIVNLMHQRGDQGVINLATYLNQLNVMRERAAEAEEDEDESGSGHIRHQTEEEQIAKIYLRKVQTLDANLDLAMKSDTLGVVESAILHSYLMLHQTSTLGLLESRRNFLANTCREILDKLFAAAKAKDAVEVSERSERALMKTRILAIDESRKMATDIMATSTTKLN